MTAALGILEQELYRSGYPVDVQIEIAKRCTELIERIERARQEAYDIPSY